MHYRFLRHRFKPLESQGKQEMTELPTVSDFQPPAGNPETVNDTTLYQELRHSTYASLYEWCGNSRPCQLLYKRVWKSSHVCVFFFSACNFVFRMNLAHKITISLTLTVVYSVIYSKTIFRFFPNDNYPTVIMTF